MRFYFLFFLFIILVSVSFVHAIGFSPTKMFFKIEQNETYCDVIRTDSDSDNINVSDIWAENKNIEWKTTLFNTSAKEHSINISYDSELSGSDREVKVCMSASELGEYHGAVLLTEEVVGNYSYANGYLD